MSAFPFESAPNPTLRDDLNALENMERENINLKMKLKQARASGLNVQVGGAGSDVAQSGRARTTHGPC